jgi:DNA polymerase-3 subunit delta'
MPAAKDEPDAMPTIQLAQLLGQPDVSTFLRGIVARQRYGNAYLFQGPAGVGKGAAALAFARAALCDRVPGAATFAPREDEAPSLFGSEPSAAALPTAIGDDACGECPACAKSASLQHPDLKFIFPVSGEEKEAENSIAETLQELRTDPLFTFQYEKAASIRVGQTRELQRELAFRPYEAARRFVVVRDCDRMREDQYSTLLKPIEEPGATTVWVLTTARASRVPATIRSRCQRVRFAPLPETLVREFLAKRAGVADGEARMLAALAGGSLARALAMRGGDALVKRDKALALTGPALRGDASGMWRGAQAFMNFGRTGREELRRAIEYHQLWLRDVLRARYGASSDTFTFADREKEVRALAAQVDATEVRRRLLVLEEALRSIDGNVSADLTLFSTLSRVAGSRMGEGQWPAHGTARWDY